MFNSSFKRFLTVTLEWLLNLAVWDFGLRDSRRDNLKLQVAGVIMKGWALTAEEWKARLHSAA